MASKLSLLERMRSNPAGDWQISDIEVLCREIGMVLEPPASGSHFKVYSDKVEGPLTIPARRPIKVPYSRLLVKLAKAHMRERSEERSG